MTGFKYIWNTILDPRHFLTAAVSVAALGLLVSYIEVHSSAESELALRQGSPAPVAVQHFRSGDNMGPAAEVTILGEVDLELATEVDVPGDDASQKVVLIPIFPLSEFGASIVGSSGNQSANSQPKPPTASRGEVPQLPEAGGLLILPAEERDLANKAYFAENVMGQGEYGTVMSLNGQRTWVGDLGEAATNAVEAKGVTLSANYLAVDPFVGGRVAALTVEENNNSGLIMWFAAGLLTISFLMQLRVQAQPSFAEVHEETWYEEDEQIEEEVLPSQRPEAFAKIPSQAEIRKAEQERIASSEPRGFGKLWSAMFGRGASPEALRNRPSHPEDEAL